MFTRWFLLTRCWAGTPRGDQEVNFGHEMFLLAKPLQSQTPIVCAMLSFADLGREARVGSRVREKKWEVVLRVLFVAAAV